MKLAFTFVMKNNNDRVIRAWLPYTGQGHLVRAPHTVDIWRVARSFSLPCGIARRDECGKAGGHCEASEVLNGLAAEGEHLSEHRKVRVMRTLRK